MRAVNIRYYAMWFPSNWATTSPRRVMVGLHGTGGAPETEWNTDWKTIVSQKNWAYVGLKYVDDSTGVHDEDDVIYSNLKALIDDLRGSAQTFPVGYRDLKDRKLFKAFGSNSGAWQPGTPMVPTLEAVVARRETNAFAGANYWMYCGGQDMVQGYPMCDGLRGAATFVTAYGGHVERLYEDPAGGHGGLAKNADAWGAMMAYFESLR